MSAHLKLPSACKQREDAVYGKSLNSHVSYSHDKWRYGCSSCLQPFAAKKDLARHCLEMHCFKPAPSFDAKTKKLKSRRSEESIHYQANSGLRKLKCLLCDRVFPIASCRTKHVWLKHAAQMGLPRLQFQCDFCAKTFRYPQVRRLHIRAVHLPERRYACAYCNGAFRSLTATKSHVTQNHKCHLCENVFVEKRDKLAHIQSVHSETQAKCEVEPESFVHTSSPRLAESHKRTAKLLRNGGSQIGAPPGRRSKAKSSLQCGFCAKEFASARCRRNHEAAIHKGILPFKCEFCDKAFRSRFHRRRHQRHGLSQTCPACGKPFQCAHFHEECFHAKTFKYRRQHEQRFRASDDAAHFEHALPKHRQSIGSVTPSILPGESMTLASCSPIESERNSRYVNSRPDLATTAGSDEVPVNMTINGSCQIGAGIGPESKDKESYCCRFCTKEFASAKCRRNHEAAIHRGILPFKCEFCDKAFRSRFHLRRHQRHGLPQTCSVCGEPFKCAHFHRECFRPFSDAVKCEGDSESPGDDRARKRKAVKCCHRCNFCAKEFASRKSWLIHEAAIHKGILPFKCVFCDTAFRSRYLANRHLLQRHPSEYPLHSKRLPVSFNCQTAIKQDAAEHPRGKSLTQGYSGDDNHKQSPAASYRESEQLEQGAGFGFNFNATDGSLSPSLVSSSR